MSKITKSSFAFESRLYEVGEIRKAGSDEETLYYNFNSTHLTLSKGLWSKEVVTDLPRHWETHGAQMNVTFYATLRNIVGAKTVELPLSAGMTVWNLVEEVIRQHPPLQTELLDVDGKLYRHVHVFVNSRDAMFLEKGLDTELAESDTVGIFPAVGGGA